MKSMVAVAVFLALVILLFVAMTELKSLRCRDFSVQADAQFFWYLGARQLDGYDQDGRACESLLKPRPGTLYL